MPRYRKKPIVIEAEQWFPDRPIEGVEYPTSKVHHWEPRGWIETLEGGHIVSPGDYIITGAKGEKYPCKPDIFEETYEKVEE